MSRFPLIDLSLVIPLHDEEESVTPLVEELLPVSLALPVPTAIVLVDDGSGDRTWKRIEPLLALHPGRLRALQLARRSGQSAAVLAGVLACRSSHVATLDGDLQNDPHDLPAMLGHLDDADVVLGRRRARKDPWARAWAGRLANTVRRAVLRDPATDSGCSLRVFPREAFLRLPAFDGMHRFLPALFERSGLSLYEIDVHHRARRGGRTKYSNLARLRRTLPDLLGVWWLARRAIRLEVPFSGRVGTGRPERPDCGGSAGDPSSTARDACG